MCKTYESPLSVKINALTIKIILIVSIHYNQKNSETTTIHVLTAQKTVYSFYINVNIQQHFLTISQSKCLNDIFFEKFRRTKNGQK